MSLGKGHPQVGAPEMQLDCRAPSMFWGHNHQPPAWTVPHVPPVPASPSRPVAPPPLPPPQPGLLHSALELEAVRSRSDPFSHAAVGIGGAEGSYSRNKDQPEPENSSDMHAWSPTPFSAVMGVSLKEACDYCRDKCHDRSSYKCHDRSSALSPEGEKRHMPRSSDGREN